MRILLEALTLLFFIVIYFFIKKAFDINILNELIDSANLDAGIFVNQIRFVRDLSFNFPTWVTAPVGYPLQYTFLFTDNFILPGTLYSFFLVLGLPEALSINLTKAFFNGLSGYLAYLYLRRSTKNAFLLASIYQNCLFIFTQKYQVQLQMHFLFPLFLLALRTEREDQNLIRASWVVMISYFCSVYYFVFLLVLLSIYCASRIGRIISFTKLTLFKILAPLLCLLPFLVPQAIISIQLPRNLLELDLYSFSPTYYFPLVPSPQYVYRGFLGYGFTIILILALMNVIGRLGALALISCLLLSACWPSLKALATWLIPFFFLFAKENKALILGALTLISLSFGLLSNSDALLDYAIKIIPPLTGIRVPVRYFVVGSMILFLLGARKLSGKSVLVLLASLLAILEAYKHDTATGPIPKAIDHPSGVDKIAVVAFPKITHGDRLDFMGYTRANQKHILRLYNKKILLYQINSGFGSYKVRTFMKEADNFPSLSSLQFLKSVGIEYVYTTKPFQSKYLKLFERREKYFIYRLKAVPFMGKFSVFIPSYMKKFAIIWSSDQKCVAKISFPGYSEYVNINSTTKVNWFTTPFWKRFDVNPLEAIIDSSQCKTVYITKIISKN
ncbi:MAG: hypothetical protein N2654_04445 [Deltaproteobacteria bacterium]|nr:hypothetical protein [Deltaproteobacteria bacterium]